MCYARLADGLCFPAEGCRLGGGVVLVELGVVEQRYQAVLEVLNDGVRTIPGQMRLIRIPRGSSSGAIERA